jgi:hypothetical protein
MSSDVGSRRQGVPLLWAILILLAGVTIAWIDTRPTWDDTGVTAGALLAAGAIGGLCGLRPWLAAAFAVSPLLVAELRTANLGLLLAPVVATVGAYGGALGRHLITAHSN